MGIVLELPLLDRWYGEHIILTSCQVVTLLFVYVDNVGVPRILVMDSPLASFSWGPSFWFLVEGRLVQSRVRYSHSYRLI